MEQNDNNNRYYFLVVVFSKGIARILQYKGVVGQFFENNYPRTFKTLKTAQKHADRIGRKFRVSTVKVYKMKKGNAISSSAFDENKTQAYYGNVIGEEIYRITPNNDVNY